MISVILKSELCIRTIVDGRDCFRGALYFHSDLHLDLLASGALHLLGGKAAVNMHTLLSQLLRFDILVTRII